MKDKSAFPHVGYEEWDQKGERFVRADGEGGMTLREYQWTEFAAAALQGQLSNTDLLKQSMEAGAERGMQRYESLTRFALDTADAMIAAIEAREREQP